MRLANHSCVLLGSVLFAGHALAQTAPASLDHPWHSAAEQTLQRDAAQMRPTEFAVDPSTTYTLAQLIDLAEAHNPETRAAWERARQQAAALGIARAELFPTLAASALALTNRDEVYLATRFYRQTSQSFDLALDLNYTLFDFGARSGRIGAARAQLLAANFAFNDVHRRLIYQVASAYYQLLNAAGLEEAARANLANAQAVEQAAEASLRNGLATLPDVLEARSEAAQADYDLQAALGAEDVAHGNLTTALGASPVSAIRVEPLDQIATPEAIEGTVEEAIDRAIRQRPDLMRQVAAIREADARLRQAHAAYFPRLTVDARPNAQSLYAMQQTLPWGHTADLDGGITFGLNWTVFDGGARKNQLAQAQADVQATTAQAHALRDRIENGIWTAYSNLKTAFRQRQAAQALLDAASKSYDAAIESYHYGVRNLLDVTEAQRTLARARYADVQARTQVLNALADLAFETADTIQPAPAGKP